MILVIQASFSKPSPLRINFRLNLQFIGLMSIVYRISTFDKNQNNICHLHASSPGSVSGASSANSSHVLGSYFYFIF